MFLKSRLKELRNIITIQEIWNLIKMLLKDSWLS